MTAADFAAIRLTLELAATTTAVLLVIGTPIAWWLARTRSMWKGVVGAVVALPLVLPPTVLGFYLLVTLGPNGPVGALTQSLGLGVLPFTFAGLVVARCCIRCFVCSRCRTRSSDRRAPARSGGHAARRRARHLRLVVLQLARPVFVTAAILASRTRSADFGVVLMIAATSSRRRASCRADLRPRAALEYADAQLPVAGMLLFSFVVLYALYSRKGRTAL